MPPGQVAHPARVGTEVNAFLTATAIPPPGEASLKNPGSSGIKFEAVPPKIQARSWYWWC